MSEQSSLQQVALLDTNMLHFVGLYLQHASKKTLFPFNADSEIADAIADINEFAEVELKKSLKRGLHVIDNIWRHDLQVEYSLVSELELITGRTKGEAILYLAKEGVPDRMWSRFPREDVICDRVGPRDLTKIADSIDELSTLFEESGVALRMHASQRTGDVLELAKFVNGLVYMEPMDSIIYASTLITEADFLFTSDKFLKKTVNLIQRGEGDRYSVINARLRDQISRVIVRSSDEVELATAHGVTADGNIRPELSSRRN